MVAYAQPTYVRWQGIAGNMTEFLFGRDDYLRRSFEAQCECNTATSAAQVRSSKRQQGNEITVRAFGMTPANLFEKSDKKIYIQQTARKCIFKLYFGKLQKKFGTWVSQQFFEKNQGNELKHGRYFSYKSSYHE